MKQETAEESYIIRNCIIHTPHLVSLEIKSRKMRWAERNER
jgi:hypothetical protein